MAVAYRIPSARPRIFEAFAGKARQPDRLMIDATHLEAHRTAARLLKKEFFPAVSEGLLNSKLHAVTGGLDRPLVFFLGADQASDYHGARHLLDRLPKAKEFVADHGYDGDWCRNGLKGRAIRVAFRPQFCVPRSARRGERSPIL